MKALAERSLARRLDFDGPADELIGHLVSLPGLNESTAQFIALRALGEPDAFPLAGTDFGEPTPLAGGSRNRHSLGEQADAWRPWRGYATLYLWRAKGKTPDAATLHRRPPTRKASSRG